MSKLPEGWAKTSLSSIVVCALGGDWGKDCDNGLNGYEKVKVVRGTDFKDWRTQRADRAAERCIKQSSLASRRLAEGDIVVEVSGGGPTQPVGRTILIDKSTIDDSSLPLVCSNFFRQVRLHAFVDSAYVQYFLSHAYFKGRFDEFQTQTTNLRNLNFTKFLEGVRIDLPPLNEQHRIAAKLEKLLSRVDAAQARLAAIPSILKRFRQSVLAAACSGALTTDWRAENPNPNPYPVKAEQFSDVDLDCPPHWRVTRLGELTELVTSGSRGWARYYSDSGSRFIRAQNINADILNLDDIAFVQLPLGTEGLRTRVRQYDLLVTITGANVTKSALVESPIEDAYISQHVALIRLANTHLSKFLFSYVTSPTHGRKQLQSAAYGQGKPGLNLDNIRDVVVCLPPLAEQEEIVRRVEALFKTADALEARYRTAEAHIDKLTQSILAKAFRGELVPQDPNDEPASILLEQIHDERRVASQKIQRIRKPVSFRDRPLGKG